MSDIRGHSAHNGAALIPVRPAARASSCCGICEPGRTGRYIGARPGTGPRRVSTARLFGHAGVDDLHRVLGASADGAARERHCPCGGCRLGGARRAVTGRRARNRNADRPPSSSHPDQADVGFTGRARAGAAVGRRLADNAGARLLRRGDRAGEHRAGYVATRRLRPRSLSGPDGPHSHAEPDGSGDRSGPRRWPTVDPRPRWRFGRIHGGGGQQRRSGVLSAAYPEAIEILSPPAYPSI